MVDASTPTLFSALGAFGAFGALGALRALWGLRGLAAFIALGATFGLLVLFQTSQALVTAITIIAKV